MDPEVDVLVVGAGPAGSSAAKAAAQRGARTLLIEKRAEIGTPVRCGEGVAKHWLEEAGIPPDRAFVAHAVDGMRIIAPDGTALRFEGANAGKGGYTVERDLFDRYLAKEAAKAGAEIRVRTGAVGLLREDGQVVGARCEHMGETFDVRADVVIGADGYESQVGRWAGLATHLRARDVVSCLQYTLVGVEGDPRLDDFYLGSCAPGGYAWVFWKGPDLANVGIGVNLSRVRNRADTRSHLDALIACVPGLAKGRAIEEVAGAVSASLPLERTVAPGILLAGDAARLIDPLTGGGILNGILSGKYAGEVAAGAVEARDPSETFLRSYEQMWKARLEEEIARHYLIKEALLRLDDATINTIFRVIVDARLPRITSRHILALLRERCPQVLTAFQALL